MNAPDLQQQIIRRGLATLSAVADPTERAALLDAAASLLSDNDLSERCRVTAACLRETEAAQLRLFKSIQR